MVFVPADAMSDAAEPPMSVSLFDSQGSKVNGNLLDSDSIDIATHTDWNTQQTVYTIESLTPLISDTRYLMISPENAGDCTLTLTAVREYGFILQTGLVFAFYSDQTYSSESLVGTLTYTNDTAEEQTLNRVLTAGKPYYLRAWTAQDYSRSEMPSSSTYSVSLTFVATTAEQVNAVNYYVNDGTDVDPVYSKLVVNGQVYGDAPEVSYGDNILVGWFTDPVLGTVIHSNDTVELTHELNLYAHWMKKGEEVIHVDENDNEEWIRITVTDDSVHVSIEGRSYTSRVVTVYDDYVVDGRIVVDTHNTASDFLVQDAKDANEQYSVVKQVLSERGLIVDNFIIIGYANSISCEEGSLKKLTESGCNDYRVIGDALSISMDNGVLGSIGDLPGETIISTRLVPADDLTPQQKEVVGDMIAYEIRITNGGHEISNLDGIITAWFKVDKDYDISQLKMYSVTDDGKLEEMDFTYEDGTVTFKTGHLSVFCLSVQDIESNSTPWWLFLLVIPVILLAVILIIGKKKGSKDEKEASA